MPPERDEAYLRLLAEHERAIAAYIYSLVRQPADAADILQESKLTMWRMFDRFEPGTDFRAWGRRIAFHQILNFRRSAKRNDHSGASTEFLEAVAQEIERRSDQLDLESELLRGCLQRLPATHRAIIVWRYYDEQEVEEIAAKTQRSAEAVYRLLSRIRRALGECVSRHLPTKAAT